jgi:hypothetical protein
MDITRRALVSGILLAAPVGLSALPGRAQPSPNSKSTPKSTPKAVPGNATGAEPATLEKPVLFDISTTSGSLKESVQNGQELVWHRKGEPAGRFFQITNIAWRCCAARPAAR